MDSYICFMAEIGVKKSVTEITVRGYILDLYGQVSNAKFMELLEEARWNHFHGLFESGMFLDMGLAMVLVNINVDYKRPAFLGEIFDIETVTKKVGNSSLTLQQTIILRKSGEIILDGELTYVLKDLKKGFAIPIVGKMREMLVKGE